MTEPRLPDPARPIAEPGPAPTPVPVNDNSVSWFRRMPNGGGTVYRTPHGGDGGETGTAGDPTK